MASFTTGQAVSPLQQTSVPTAYAGDAQDLARSQRLAQMLMSNEMPQGQMVSGRYVAPSIFQNIAQLVNTGTGAYFADKAQKQQLDLARKIREGEQTALQEYMTGVKGVPATDSSAEIPANPFVANMRLAQNELAPSWLRQHAISQVIKPPNYKEVNIVNKQTGDTETYRYDGNAADPTKTYQLLGTSKTALSPAEKIRMADEGINTNIGGSSSVSSPVAGAPNAVPVNQNTSPVVKPASSANKNELVNAFGYDPFVAPPPPASIVGGKDMRNYKLDQAKPLTGTAADQVTGAKLYTDSLIKYNDYVNTLTASDLANPSVRVKLTSLHSQAKLAGKEANKLGVLNGGDERILEEVLPNYKDITVTKKNLNNLIQGQKEFGTSIIVNAYGTQQKAVPENMRKYVVVPKQAGEEAAPKSPSTTTQRAIYNGENIIVKNGKWVYERTGKEVK
jgi:hypothetical protein